MLAIFYHVIYFIGLPAILLYFYLKFRSQTEFINFFGALASKDSRENRARREQVEKKRRRLKVIFVLVLVAFLLSWHLVTSELVNIRMKGEIRYAATGIYAENPVVVSLGPTYNVENVVETIRNKEERWLPNQVEKVVDLDDLANFKGRIAVYRTYDQRYIITHTYLLPYPVVKCFGFQYVETDDGQLKIVKKDVRTIFYPFDPGTADDTAKLVG